MSDPGTYKLDKESPKRFLWQSYPKAQTFLDHHLSRFLVPLEVTLSSSVLREIVMLRDAATTVGIRFFDLLDYVRLAVPSSTEILLQKQGFTFQEKKYGKQRVYTHKGALFPALILEKVQTEKASAILDIALKSENLEHLKKTRGYTESIEGEKESPYRKLSLSDGRGRTLTFVERKGSSCFESFDEKGDPEKIKKVQHLFGLHRDMHLRPLEGTEEAFDKTLDLVKEAMALVGRDRAAYEWVGAEIRFWEERNRAAAIQGKLQRNIGLGWVNKDHITYRNSKAFFPKTVEILFHLGFEKRERLHAEEFTAQVMEHKRLGLAAFVDVDPPEKRELGTVGLWVKIHGESMLSAGLHHMAARYNFLAVQEVLKKQGVQFRSPFSNFEDLKQVFTEGEMRRIPEVHAKRLFREGMISEAQRREYTTKGAVYTHLEDIQRGNGFKGFNQHSISRTLRDTGKTLRLKRI